MTKKSRISPAIPKSTNGVEYADLDDGDAFIHNGKLYIKMDAHGQEGIGLGGGWDVLDDMCGIYVIPVDIQITWKEKK